MTEQKIREEFGQKFPWQYHGCSQKCLEEMADWWLQKLAEVRWETIKVLTDSLPKELKPKKLEEAINTIEVAEISNVIGYNSCLSKIKQILNMKNKILTIIIEVLRVVSYIALGTFIGKIMNGTCKF